MLPSVQEQRAGRVDKGIREAGQERQIISTLVQYSIERHKKKTLTFTRASNFVITSPDTLYMPAFPNILGGHSFWAAANVARFVDTLQNRFADIAADLQRVTGTKLCGKLGEQLAFPTLVMRKH